MLISPFGTTGSPKGIVRDAAGHAVGMNLCMRYMFGIRGPNEVMFAASDIGWVFGHSFIVYGPLLAGATTILFEGKPSGTPDASTFWRIVSEHQVTVLCTAPSALRAIRSYDPENYLFRTLGEKGALKSLRAIFLGGERSEPSVVRLYQALLSDYCGLHSLVVDHWWSTETGSPITGITLSSPCGLDFNTSEDCQPLLTKPGSAGKPMPGFDVRVVDDEGREVPQGTSGNIALALPLAPTALTSLWRDDDRFYNSYLKRFSGRFMDTGDEGLIDEEGYVHILSRSDDIINVAAHRLSSGKVPQLSDMCLFYSEPRLTCDNFMISGH
jgi:propionyl-CoA synthetase